MPPLRLSKVAVTVVLLSILQEYKCSAFHQSHLGGRSWITSVPTKLFATLQPDPSTCSFKEALDLGTSICDELQKKGSLDCTEDLKKLLSHEKGVKGFFVKYLTDSFYTIADQPKVPNEVVDAIVNCNLSVEGARVLIMNALLPTSESSSLDDVAHHTAGSKRTVSRGLRVLKAARETCPLVEQELSAAREAAEDLRAQLHGQRTPLQQTLPESVSFWGKCFKKWGYDEVHVERISSDLRKLGYLLYSTKLA